MSINKWKNKAVTEQVSQEMLPNILKNCVDIIHCSTDKTQEHMNAKADIRAVVSCFEVRIN